MTNQKVDNQKNQYAKDLQLSIVNDKLGWAIVDGFGRELLKISENGEVAFARYPDMQDNVKSLLCILLMSLSDKDPAELTHFLNFEDQEIFCS